MRSKKSFFNMTLYKKDLTRFWMFPLLYFVILGFTMPVLIWQQMSYNATYLEYSKMRAAMEFANFVANQANPIMIAIVAEVIVVSVFSYLFSTRSAYMMHAFPTNRLQLFVTGVLSSLTMLIVPQFLAILLTCVVGAAYGCSVTIAFQVFMYLVLYDIFFVGFASCVVMISGQMIAAVVFYGIFNFLYLGMEVAIKIVATVLLEGLDDALNDMDFNVLTPIAYLIKSTGIKVKPEWDYSHSDLISFTVNTNGLGVALAYAAVGVAFAVLGYVIYKNKKMETVNDFIAVKFMKYVFVYGMSFFVSIVAGTGIAIIISETGKETTYNLVFAYALISSIIIAVIIFYACQMLVDKSFRVFSSKRWKYVSVYVAYMIVFFVGFKVDFFNIATRVPEASDVSELLVDINGVYRTEDQAEIAEWIDIHKEMVGNIDALRDARYSNVVDYSYLSVCYKMNNGKKIYRSYKLTKPDGKDADYKDVCGLVENYLSKPERIKYSFIGPEWDDARVDYVEFMNHTQDIYGEYCGEWNTLARLSDEESRNLYEALLKDIDQGNFGKTIIGSYWADDAYFNELNIVLISKEPFVRYYTVKSNYNYEDTYMHTNIILNPKCDNLINALIEYKVIDSKDDLLLWSELNSMYE